jgi:putative alpha-1,2-mannosidase
MFPFVLFSVVLCWTVLVSAIDHPEEMVSLLAGSFTDGDRFSTGNTLPLVGRPWGFNHWAPMTREGNRHVGSWWFKGSDHQLTWLRCTHQPSPWIGDWGWFLFSPQLGGVTRNPVHYWEPRGAVLKPYLLDATVAPHGIRMELTPTDHGAFLRVTFPKRKI